MRTGLKTEGYPLTLTQDEIMSAVSKAARSPKMAESIVHQWERENLGIAYPQVGNIRISVLKPVSKGSIAFSELDNRCREIVELSKKHNWTLRSKKVSGATLPSAIELSWGDLHDKVLSQSAMMRAILDVSLEISSTMAKEIHRLPAFRSFDITKLNNLLNLLTFYQKLIELRQELGGSLNCEMRAVDVQGYDTKYFEKNFSRLSELFSMDKERSSQQADLGTYLGLSEKNQRVRLRHLQKVYASRENQDASDRPHFINDGDIEVDVNVAAREIASPHITRVVVVENLFSYLNFPAIEGTVAIWGKGMAILALARDLVLSEKEIFYWGDMDYSGFQILAKFREIYNQTRSILMDTNALELYPGVPVPDTSFKVGPDESWKELLSDSERKALSLLQGRRIEQEFLNQVLNSALPRYLNAIEEPKERT